MTHKFIADIYQERKTHKMNNSLLLIIEGAYLQTFLHSLMLRKKKPEA